MKSSDIQCVLVVITIAGLVIEARKLFDRNRIGLPIPDRRIGEILDIVDFRRKWNVRPMIEMGPGVVKTEPSKFPENQLAKDLKKLIYLKKKRDSSKVKDFNADKEFLNRK